MDTGYYIKGPSVVIMMFKIEKDLFIYTIR